jgi:hypothetical protein
MIAESAMMQCMKIPSTDKRQPCEMLLNEIQGVSKKPQEKPV